ncbi:DeoR/GlpR family DNA-binding transcription regulator [Pedobacter cryoconitis]|uniref:DeoR/GlpR family transcriptional regulator of sugar metabolism n=1 Tax=Pedobacter cryoconitis TaxID=188932 RepID=A0A7X0J5V3_9SPHI|nr:DeoR/GlpR family DNA-binding transcription regulator [Pedobacter cryoconitis]MBB6500186.1 DeoR/GlpR family transcriptional regulator of sugar metabolism [Pedobacter cryoconitis]
MIKAERLQLIIEHIRRERKVLLGDLSTLLEVSEDTVRRDIKELSDQGLLKAVRGGAISHSPIPLHFREREHYDVSHKEIIALKAVKFLKNGQVVLFDSGTSVLAIATHLPRDLQITVITNSFPVASVLEDHPLIEVIFLGGRLNKSSFSTSGFEVIQVIREFRPDVCFLGICSIDLTSGVTGISYEDSQVKKAMVETSKQIIALATLEKLNTTEPYYITSISDIDIIITDTDPDHETLQNYKGIGIKLE